MKVSKNSLKLGFVALSVACVSACAHNSPSRSIAPDSVVANSPAKSESPRQGRPNIVVILADDMGYSDLGLFGSGIATPNIDQLARNGLILTQFYNEAKCTESRAALMTGRPSRAVLRPSSGEGALDPALAHSVPILPERLSALGYETMIAGKWHLGEREGDWPDKRGFDRSFSLVTGASSYFEMRMREAQDDPEEASNWPSKPFMIKDGARWPVPAQGFYMTDAIGDAALSMVDGHLRERPQQPFFLYLAFTAPHFPLHALPEDIARYKGHFDAGWNVWRDRRVAEMRARGLLAPGAKIASAPASVGAWESADVKAEWARRMEVYAAQLDRLDQNVGKLLSMLRVRGQFDNTLILFLSDNGAVSTSPRQMAREFGYVVPGAVIGSRESNTVYGEPWAHVSNAPLRNYKQSLYEGGIRTPLVVSWPKGLRRKGISDTPGQIIDLAPTLVRLAGGNVAATEVSGVDISALITTRKTVTPPRRFWVYKGYRAVRDGHWKAIAAGPRAPWQLFDLSADPGETTDLSASEPARTASLAAAWDDWAQRDGKPYQGGARQ